MARGPDGRESILARPGHVAGGQGRRARRQHEAVPVDDKAGGLALTRLLHHARVYEHFTVRPE